MPCDVLLKNPVEKLVPSAVYCDVHDAKNLNFLNLNDFSPKTYPKSDKCSVCHTHPFLGNLQSSQPNNDLPIGALPGNIRSLVCRNRFPVGNSRLPLKSLCGKTNYISFKILQPEKGSLAQDISENKHLQVLLLCYETRFSKVPYYEAPLYGAEMIAKTFTEFGPSLYLITKKGNYRFTCSATGFYNYQFWETQMFFLGVKIIMPQDLFIPTSSQPLGEGSFAKVFTAIHKFTGKSIVVKRMPKNRVSALPPDQQSAVQLEIGILRQISHPYVVKFELAYEDDHYHYIVLEKLKGGTVNRWLREHKRMTEEQARQVIERILLVLVELQARNIVHRDLKPENLVLQSPNDPTSLKIIDFGLAAYLNTNRMKMFCGSPGFVAPEIIEKQPYGKSVDMFSVGVLLYVFLSGKTPFHSGRNSPSMTLLRNKRCEINFDSKVWKDISAEAKDFVVALLKKDPNERISLENALDSPWMTQSRIPSIPLESLPQLPPYSDKNKQSASFLNNYPIVHKNVNKALQDLCTSRNNQNSQPIHGNEFVQATDPPIHLFKANYNPYARDKAFFFYPGLTQQDMDTTDTETPNPLHHAIRPNIYNSHLNFFEAKKITVSISHQLECN